MSTKTKPVVETVSPDDCKKQVNINLSPEGRQCLEELTQILDLSASAVINQALRAWRLSEEIVGIDQRKQEVLGSAPAKARKCSSQKACEVNSSIGKDPRT